MKQIRVLLADDQEMVRQGLTLLIDRQPDMQVVGEAGDRRAVLDAVASLQPHVAVVDMSMPKMNGPAAMRGICEQAPSTAIVALTRHTDESYVSGLFDAGALGCVLKQSSSRELVDAVRAAAAGRRYLDSSLAARVASPIDGSGRGAPRVTDRESEVLRLMSLGHSNKAIAGDLCLSVKTVEVHKANAMRKLGLTRRTDIVRYALLQGWLRDP